MNTTVWVVLISGFLTISLMATVLWALDRGQQTRCMRKMCSLRQNMVGSISLLLNTMLLLALLIAIGITTMAFIYYGAIPRK